MFHGSEEDDEKHEMAVEALRHENLLVYSKPSAGCLVDQRQHKSLNFSSLQYTLGSTMQILMNSGADAIYGPGCFMRLQMQVTMQGAGLTQSSLDFGRGSVMNLFRNMRLIHRSGNPLEEIINVNSVAQMKRMWGLSVDDKRKLDGMLNCYSPHVDSVTFVPAFSAVGNTILNPDGGAINPLPVRLLAGVPVAGPVTYNYVFCIPMHMISGVFGSETQMIPPALLAGAKMEIDLDNGNTAFTNFTVWSGGTTLGVVNTITPTIVYDSNVLFSSVNKQLLMEQAAEPSPGLAFTYSTWFTTNSPFAADASLDVSQSVSLCEKCAVGVRVNAAIGTGAGDSFNFLAPYNSYQFRIGSTYLPLKPVVVPVPAAFAAQQSANASQEVYAMALLAWAAGVDQYHKSAGEASNVPFYSDVSWPTLAATNILPSNTSFTSGAACYATSLEKSPCGLEFSGQSSNNARILNVQLTGPSTVGAVTGPWNVMAMLEYIRSAVVSGDNCIVNR